MASLSRRWLRIVLLGIMVGLVGGARAAKPTPERVAREAEHEALLVLPVKGGEARCAPQRLDAQIRAEAKALGVEGGRVELGPERLYADQEEAGKGPRVEFLNRRVFPWLTRLTIGRTSRSPWSRSGSRT